MKRMKSWLLDAVAVVFFAILAFAYFYPADIQNRVLNQGDISAGIGAGEEASQYYNRTGERTRWTNALFSGMPTYQMSPSYDSTDTLSAVEKAYHLWLPDYVWHLFAYLLGFYILLRAFDFKQYLAALGSIFWAFSTYFLIIIAAGHMWKVMALAYLPPMIGGLVLSYRGKYLWGMVVTALFAALEVHANHVQMTYYYLFVIVLMALAFLVDAILKKEYVHFLKATAACLVGGLLGVLVNASNLYHTWEYSKETMRGKSELVKDNADNQTNSGLERSYITDYSYGIGETWTLLVPNAKGGTSMRLLFDDEGAKEAIRNVNINVGNGQTVPAPQVFDYLMQNGLYFTQYWEDNLEEGANGTMGPVYVGAFVLMLAVLALLICYRNPLVWGLLAATLLSIMLAWGKNFMGLTNLFIDYIPMYAKFRAVESILVIAEFTIPLMAMLALRELVAQREAITSQASSLKAQRSNLSILIAFALTGGLCLLFALMPATFFDFYSNAESQLFRQFMPEGADGLLDALSSARQAVFTADCWRSLLFIVLGTAVLLLYRARKLKTWMMAALLLVICLTDLWQVNRRYLNPNDTTQFVKKVERQQIRPMSEADRQIKDDPTLSYRVLNLASNAFNENMTSYYHKSVGGYHAAKLRRYQELIEKYIAQQKGVVDRVVNELSTDLTQVPGDSIWPVLNMLNTKYFLSPQRGAVENPFALGNAWFVDKVRYVDNANQELDGIAQVDLRREAVADKQFQEVLGQAAVQDSTASVVLTAYEPNQLTYQVGSDKGGVLVFSEIYYPGWTATVDGQETGIGRVNYVLRALHIAPGSHEVVLSFYPKTVNTTETIAYVAMGILLLLAVGVVIIQFRHRKKA